MDSTLKCNTMNRCYDSINKRLVFWGDRADSQFWDSHWSMDDFTKHIRVTRNPFVINNTKKYLPKGAKILDGGCGIGDKVYVLQNNGYNAYGVDFAEETVSKINHAVPDLRVTLGDVRHLVFPGCFFDGYWSLGVIEHFFDGYVTIAEEMHRVLRNGGYLFLTVPSMSLIRKIKALLRIYPAFDDQSEIRDAFFQFALSKKSVIKRFNSIGFKLITHRPYDGVLGLHSEIGIFRPPLQWCIDHNNIFAKVMWTLINIAVTPISGHISFFVFRKV